MKKFEYEFKQMKFDWSFNKEATKENILHELNRLGDEGWELVDFGSLTHGWLLKREIEKQ